MGYAKVLEPRIVYQDTDAAIRVRGFGHRWLPDQMQRGDLSVTQEAVRYIL